MWAEPKGRAPPIAPPFCHGAAAETGQGQNIHLGWPSGAATWPGTSGSMAL